MANPWGRPEGWSSKAILPWDRSKSLEKYLEKTHQFNSDSSSSLKTPTISKNYDLSDYISRNVQTSGGTGGYYTYDPTNAIKAYRQQADSDRAVAKQTYDTTRNDLLTSLKRFQEQNAKDVSNQKQSFLTNQASLESARADADRQNRISAAARGLGGSGLQQLSQLQNLLSQGQDISNLATENSSAMDKLKQALQQKEEDTDKGVANALTTYNNALNSINAALSGNIANAEAQRAASYVAPSGGSSNYNEVLSKADSAAAAMYGIVDAYNKGTKDSNTGKRVTYKDSRSYLSSVLEEYGVNPNSSAAKKAFDQLYRLKEYKKKVDKAKQ